MKRLFFSLICMSISVMAMAQLPIGNMLSSNQQLIEDAVNDGLFVVLQNYQLKDTTTATPEYWGLNGAPHFGSTYSLAVKVMGGYYIDDKAAHPWLYDSNFNEYRNSRKFASVVSQTNVRQLDSISYMSIAFKEKPLTAVVDSQLYYVADSATFGQGFLVDNAPGEKKGWLVWAVSDKPIQTAQDTLPVSLFVYREELNFVSEQAAYKVKKPTTNKTVLGGIYVLPEVTAIGIVMIKLSGVLHLNNGKWEVIRIKDDSAATTVIVPETVGRLTPITLPQQESDRVNKKKKENKKKKS